MLETLLFGFGFDSFAVYVPNVGFGKLLVIVHVVEEGGGLDFQGLVWREWLVVVFVGR